MINLADKEVVLQRMQQLKDAIEVSTDCIEKHGQNGLATFDNLRRLNADLKMSVDALVEQNERLRTANARYRKLEEARSREASRQARWDADYVESHDPYEDR